MMVFIANFVQKYKPKQLMNNKTLIVGACLAVAGSLNAQNKDGGISLQMLQQIRHKAVLMLTRILAWKHPSKTYKTKRVREDAGCLLA